MVPLKCNLMPACIPHTVILKPTITLYVLQYIRDEIKVQQRNNNKL